MYGFLNPLHASLHNFNTALLYTKGPNSFCFSDKQIYDSQKIENLFKISPPEPTLSGTIVGAL
jgi:hypothetical protein